MRAQWISGMKSQTPLSKTPNLPQSQLKPFSPNYSLASGLNSSSSLFVSLSTVLLSVLQANGQTEMKRVVGNNATLPCHHHLWQADISLLDIEWMLHKSSSRQKVVSMTTCVCLIPRHCDIVLLMLAFAVHHSPWSAVQCFFAACLSVNCTINWCCNQHCKNRSLLICHCFASYHP